MIEKNLNFVEYELLKRKGLGVNPTKNTPPKSYKTRPVMELL